MLTGWINADRTAHGLVPWRAWGAIDGLATERAERVAASGTLSHTAAGGNVGDALTAASIPWSWYGEALGMTGTVLGETAARQIFGAWMASDPHRAILRSNVDNYLGIGIGVGADGSTWISLIATQSPDRTPPVASIASLRRSGSVITVAWRGVDPRLQSLTAGIRSFDVQIRRDGLPWETLRNDTTTASARLPSLRHGHWYSFRVQAADRRGTLSAWTTPIRIWLP